MEIAKFNISLENENKRIDVFLNEEFQDFSRSRIQKIIKDENVRVNGKPINKNYKLKNKDLLEVFIEPPKEVNILAENIPLDVVYEDRDIILVNKPQGMVVHPSNGHYTGTLVNALLYHCKEELSGINGDLRPGIVHRIDKDTSGILVVAKNDNAHKKLASQLESHSMNRTYYAVVCNKVKKDSGTIDLPIGRHEIDRKKMAVNFKNSKNAITHYKVLERFKGYSLVKLNLETGRTHQIRVHMAYIGNPILGDLVYGVKKPNFKTFGQTLHAKSLGFIHPSSGEYIEFETDFPEYFKKIMAKLV